MSIGLLRKEIRKQVRRGWVTRKVAALLLGYDLDMARLDNLLKLGSIDAKSVDGEQHLNVHHLLTAAGTNLDSILDRCLPIDRHRRDVPRNEFRILTTVTARECFQRQWDRLHRHVAKLVADREEDLSPREMRLSHQLLEAARFYKRFNLIFTGAKLRERTGLDDEYLPKARRSLERRGLIASSPAGTVGIKIVLHDPRTKQPFEDCRDDAATDTLAIKPASDWDDWAEDD